MSKTLYATLLTWVFAVPAGAIIVANGPDDVCAPTADPCVISDVVEVLPPGVLDFGLRTVQVTGAGQLKGTSSVLCGDFLVDVGANNTAVDLRLGGQTAGTFSVTAQRGCSGDPTVACLDDVACSVLAVGTCSVGGGVINFDGKLIASGNPGGDVVLDASGDVTLSGTIKIDGSVGGANAGTLKIESFTGSVISNAKIEGNAGPSSGYTYAEYAGDVTMIASQDISTGASMELSGGRGGAAQLEASGNITVGDDITSNGGNVSGASGGSIGFSAGGDLLIAGSTIPGDKTRLSANGNSVLYYGYLYQGYGGYGTFYADGNVIFEDHAKFIGNSGFGGCSGEPLGANVYFSGDTITLDGEVVAQGLGRCGQGGLMNFEAYGGGLAVGSSGLIDGHSKTGAELTIRSDGPVRIDGTVDVRGRNLSGAGEYAYGGYGGMLDLRVGNDVTIGGKILNGADINGGFTEIDVCRLRMLDGGRIDNANGSPQETAGDNDLVIRESMIMDAGSQLIAGTSTDYWQGQNNIRYRDADKPPILAGTVAPSVSLVLDPALGGCSVCGNSEIDQDESCDDGNTADGDFCSGQCQDEGCVAGTPGFPGVSLCDDGDDCTVDTCDNVAHTCEHLASCEEGIACTVDTCGPGNVCQHTPSDAACDDGNDCTDDICNATTGCVYANLSATTCNDGDLCTPAGTCSAGVCQSNGVRAASRNKITVKFKDGAANDRLKAKGELPLSDFSSAPTVTGLLVDLRDAAGQTIYTAAIAASDFDDKSSATAGKYRFRDSAGLIPSANGIVQVKVIEVPSKGVAKYRVTMKGTEVTGALLQSELSFSLLFGADPAVDDCLTARGVPCKATTKKTACKD